MTLEALTTLLTIALLFAGIGGSHLINRLRGEE